VPQAVGVHPPVDPGFGGQARQQAADIAGVQSPAGQRAEDRRSRSGGELAATIQAPPAPPRSARRCQPCGTCRPCRGAPGRCRPQGRRRAALMPALRRSAVRSATAPRSAPGCAPPSARGSSTPLISAIASASESTSGGRRRDPDAVDVVLGRVALTWRPPRRAGARRRCGSDPQTSRPRPARRRVGRSARRSPRPGDGGPR